MKLCECGCKRYTNIALKTNKKRNWIKGEPVRFIQGHQGRLRPKGVIDYEIELTTGCWIWKRAKTSTGYGHLTINNKQVLAHRFVYEKYKGTIPEGLTLDHLCRNTLCVNPDHLEPVTHAMNCRRGKNTKLIPQVREYIKYQVSKGISRRQIARDLGISHTPIINYLRGISWT